MNCRAFLSAKGQLWTERVGPARSMFGSELFDLCGRGPPHQSPEGWPCAKVPTTADIVFEGLWCVEGTGIAWTKRDVYVWGCGQTVMRDCALHTPIIMWSAPSDIASVAAADRALLIITCDGRLFGAGNRSWGSCTPEARQSDVVEIQLPKGKSAARVSLRAYFSNTYLLCTDGSIFWFDDVSTEWVSAASLDALLEKFE